jgi:methionyl-tRNA formyltransferase
MGRNIVGVFTAHDDLGPHIADFVPFPSLDVPLHRITSSRSPETVAAVKELKPDLIVVISWSQIIPAAIIDTPVLGCVGIHYSLLPARRGGAPLSWAIIDGLSESGITLFYLDDGVDAGDIIAQRRFQIGPRDTVADLLDKVVGLAPGLLAEYEPALEQGTAPRVKQDESLASYTTRRTPADGEIDWSRSLTEIDRFIRAQAPPYPCAFTGLGSERRLVVEFARLDEAGERLHITGYVE